MKKNKIQLFVILILLLAVFLIASNKIERRDNGDNDSWSVHFISNYYNEEEGSVSAITHSLNDTNFSFQVKLTNPGDYYEASIEIINDGNIDAVLDRITLGGLTEEQEKYITYEINYDEDIYTENMKNINKVLEAGNKTIIKIRIEYNANSNMTEEQTVDITTAFDFSSR